LTTGKRVETNLQAPFFCFQRHNPGSGTQKNRTATWRSGKEEKIAAGGLVQTPKQQLKDSAGSLPGDDIKITR
jgi:hypothetical protein